MASPATAKYDWILALTSIAFVFSSTGNGANDVANSYATSVAARTLSMKQVGGLAAITEFVGAVALGSRVTDTIKNSIISIDRFKGKPATLMLAMGCAEAGNATWLAIANMVGFPVSTTQTVVGAIIGVGFASQSSIQWGWEDGSVSQIAASWGIAPLIAAGFSSVIFFTLKFSILDRAEPFKWAMRLIPIYLATTGAILALFIVVESPTAPSLEEFGAGKAVGIILGVFFGCLLVACVFFMPYFHRRLVKQDARLRYWHVPLGPLLLKENPPIYLPSKGEDYVINYYEDAYGEVQAGRKDREKRVASSQHSIAIGASQNDTPTLAVSPQPGQDIERDLDTSRPRRRRPIGPHERFIQPVKALRWTNPKKVLGYTKWFFLQGVTRDVLTQSSELLRDIHSRAHRYDDRVEHLWTYCQVVSAMMMSIAHGSNDFANAVGPWAATYSTYQSGVVNTDAPTPVWMLVVAGCLLGLGFWFYGYHIMRALGNRITQMSPTRGFSAEMGAAITVLIASRLGLPVSTTQCLTGAAMGVALMNFDLKAVNWRQLLFIFGGWVLTLPCAGLIAGLLCLMALNTPHF